jgi:hypothetical protein
VELLTCLGSISPVGMPRARLGVFRSCSVGNLESVMTSCELGIRSSSRGECAEPTWLCGSNGHAGFRLGPAAVGGCGPIKGRLIISRGRLGPEAIDNLSLSGFEDNTAPHAIQTFQIGYLAYPQQKNIPCDILLLHVLLDSRHRQQEEPGLG